MARAGKDPTEAMCLKAGKYVDVDEGTACTQSSFKTAKKSFFYVGQQGGRYKAMFKLEKSLAVAAKLAEKSPEDFQVGAHGWVTARFSAEDPMPRKLWESWLDESYELARPAAGKKKTAKKKAVKKTVKKKTARKKTS